MGAVDTKTQSAAIAIKEMSPGKAAPGYLVFGDEAYWHRRLVEALAEAFPGGAENLPGDETTWEALRDILAQPSFFGPSLWVVHRAETMFASDSAGRVDGVSPGSCLVLSCATKENPAKAEFLEKWATLGGRLIEAEEPSFAEATQWVGDTLRRQGFSFTGEAVENLVTITGRSIERLEKELEKVETYMGAGSSAAAREVTATVILQCASQDPEKTSFGLIDAVATRAPAKALTEYLDLKARGANQVMIIALLASHFGLLWRAKEAEIKGTSQSSLPKALGVHPYSARKASQQARNWSFRELEAALNLLCDVDENLKRGRTDPDRAMDYLLSSLARRQ